MKRPLVPILIAVLAAAAVAVAQGPGGGPGQGINGPGPGGGPPGPPMDCLIEYLSLTDEQVAAWQELNDQARIDAEPLQQQLRDLDEQLREQFESDAPDATTIGELTIAAHDLRDQMRHIRDANDAAFLALLTDEQQARYSGFMEMQQVCGRPNGGGPPMMGGPGGQSGQSSRSRPQRGQGPPQQRW